MLYPESKINVSDNSGARIVKCIKVLKSSKRSGAKPASILVTSVRKIKFSKTILKGQIYKGILLRGRKNVQRNTGVSIKFNDNSLILVDQKILPLSTRIYGPTYKELRYKDYPKVLALAKIII